MTLFSFIVQKHVLQCYIRDKCEYPTHDSSRIRFTSKGHGCDFNHLARGTRNIFSDRFSCFSEMKGIASLSSLSAVLAVVIVLISGPVLSSDVNWGKKVNCFVVEETVVCPGCNYRAGLTCPRKLKESQNCLLPSTEKPFTTRPTNLPKTTYKEINSTETLYEGFNSSEKVLLNYTQTTPQTNEIQKEPTEKPIDVDMAIYLYRLLTSEGQQYYRFKRELQQQQQKEEEEEEPEICNWNGDCPCPQICCKTGPGCPKRCVMGIRLPPPWG